VRLGAIDRAEQTLGGLRDEDRDRGEIRVAEEVLRLAQDDPRAATAALAPVPDGSAPVVWPNWLVSVFALEAIVRDALSDRAAAWRALEEAFLALTGQPASGRAGTGPDRGSELAAARRASGSGSPR
jgi:LuxR family maltose regulon positive regulatory protein